MKSIETGSKTSYPNGFDALQICAIARYAGLSDRISSLGIFEIPNKSLSHALVAQLIWYFVEGVNCRVKDDSFNDDATFQKYNVIIEDDDLIFYKSVKTGRWWIEIPFVEYSNTKSQQHPLLACMYEDYETATKGTIPERWFKAYKKK